MSGKGQGREGKQGLRAQATITCICALVGYLDRGVACSTHHKCRRAHNAVSASSLASAGSRAAGGRRAARASAFPAGARPRLPKLLPHRGLLHGAGGGGSGRFVMSHKCGGRDVREAEQQQHRICPGLATCVCKRHGPPLLCSPCSPLPLQACWWCRREWGACQRCCPTKCCCWLSPLPTG